MMKVDVIVGVDERALGVQLTENLLEEIADQVLGIPGVEAADVFQDAIEEGHYVLVPVTPKIGTKGAERIAKQIYLILDNIKDTSPWVEEGESGTS
jgi:hypothetical protein